MEGRKANHNNFSSEPPRNPRPFNIIFLKCLILQDKTIFKESGHVRMKYQIFVNRKKGSIELQISSLMSLKMFTFLYAHFQIFLVQNAANNSEFIELQYFLLTIVKTIEYFRVVPWEKLQAEVCQIFCILFYITKVSHNGGRRNLSLPK